MEIAKLSKILSVQTLKHTVEKIQAQQNITIFVKFAPLICGFVQRTVALTESTGLTE